MSDSDSEGGVPLLEAQFDTAASSKKRKREAEPEATKESKKAAKKQKRKEKKKQKAKEIDEDDLDQALGVNHSFERMDGQLVADYVNARTRLYGKELSSVELEDKFIPAFLKQQCATLQATPKKPVGAPHTIVVTASGIRAADLCRSLKAGLPKEGVKDANVAKLFAKHMKLAEQVAHLKKSKIDIGVGTPDRLAALLEEKALSTANLKQVVIDVSYIDQKKRGILDMKELHDSLIKFLLRKNFVGEGKERGENLFLFY